MVSRHSIVILRPTHIHTDTNTNAHNIQSRETSPEAADVEVRSGKRKKNTHIPERPKKWQIMPQRCTRICIHRFGSRVWRLGATVLGMAFTASVATPSSRKTNPSPSKCE